MIEKKAPQQQMTLEQAMQLAVQYQESGQLLEADSILKQILQSYPNNDVALHLLGVIHHQAGRTDIAIDIIKQAISINKKNAHYFSNIGEMCRQTLKLGDAIKYGQQAVKISPKSATALSNLGIAYFDNNDLDIAEAYQKKAVGINPKLICAINSLGSIARNRKDKKMAIHYYQEALSIDSNNIESKNNLAAMFTESDRATEAISLLVSIINSNPNYIEAYYNLGVAYLDLQNTRQAKKLFNKVLELQSDYVGAFRGLAHSYRLEKETDLAIENALNALSITPNSLVIHTLLGSIYRESGFPDKALVSFKKALEVDVEYLPAHLAKGRLLMELGDIPAAKQDFQTALKIDDKSLAARIALIQVNKVTVDDENMLRLIGLDKDNTLSAKKASSLHFALGKAYDDTKQYDLAFKHYFEGCQLKRKRIDYDSKDNDDSINRIISFFSKEKIDVLRGKGCLSNTPIFVLGMPRSGTTLTEQIIASHSDVYGAGELPDLSYLANHTNGEAVNSYPDGLLDFNQKQLATLGEKYIDGLKEREPNAKYITDKMPANFNLLGLIHLILPNAKIVHVKRNPIDTCLSGFSRIFKHNNQPHSYDLKEIGLYYRNYHRLMQHWKKVLPKDSFYEINYEDIVADTECEARALIKYCGLDWSDNCLNFHKTKRSIRTASVTQVRQPIYTTSVERWKSYEEHLVPLFDALGDLIPQQKRPTPVKM